LRIITYMPWNSYLCSVAGYVHPTHLHEDSDGSGRIQVAPVEVVLAVGDATCDGIASEEFEMASEFEDNLPMKKRHPRNSAMLPRSSCTHTHYPDLKPQDQCPCCEVRIGFHANPRPESLSGAPPSQGTGWEGAGHGCSTDGQNRA
jgi:hypothetical protein